MLHLNYSNSTTIPGHQMNGITPQISKENNVKAPPSSQHQPPSSFTHIHPPLDSPPSNSLPSPTSLSRTDFRSKHLFAHRSLVAALLGLFLKMAGFLNWTPFPIILGIHPHEFPDLLPFVSEYLACVHESPKLVSVVTSHPTLHHLSRPTSEAK